MSLRSNPLYIYDSENLFLYWSLFKRFFENLRSNPLYIYDSENLFLYWSLFKRFFENLCKLKLKPALIF